MIFIPAHNLYCQQLSSSVLLMATSTIWVHVLLLEYWNSHHSSQIQRSLWMYQPSVTSDKPYALVEQKPVDKFEKYKKQLKPVVWWKNHQADLQERGMEIQQSLSFTVTADRRSGPLMTPGEVDIVVEDADTSELSEAVHNSASKRSTVNLSVSKDSLLSSNNHLGTLWQCFI